MLNWGLPKVTLTRVFNVGKIGYKMRADKIELTMPLLFPVPKLLLVYVVNSTLFS